MAETRIRQPSGESVERNWNMGDTIAAVGLAMLPVAFILGLAGIWADHRWGETAALFAVPGIIAIFFGAIISNETDKTRRK